MAKSGQSRAEANREMRREELRKQLAAQKHHEKVFDIIKKLYDLEGVDLDSLEVTRLKAAADLSASMLRKYLPDVKAVEVTGSEGEPVKTDTTFTILPVSAPATDT